MAQGLCQGCVLSSLLFKVLFAAILIAALEKFSKNTDIFLDLAHLQEQPSKVAPETALECARHAIRMLYADVVCIVLRSPRGLQHMMVVFVEIFGAFGTSISESETTTMCMSILRALIT